jgi:hypothetical protein
VTAYTMMHWTKLDWPVSMLVVWTGDVTKLVGGPPVVVVPCCRICIQRVNCFARVTLTAFSVSSVFGYGAIFFVGGNPRGLMLTTFIVPFFHIELHGTVPSPCCGPKRPNVRIVRVNAGIIHCVERHGATFTRCASLSSFQHLDVRIFVC